MKFAQLNSSNIVINISLVEDEVILDSNNIPQESLGIDFLIKTTGHSNWKSYDHSSPSKTAVIGGFYDQDTNTFKPKKLFNSWVFNEEKWAWNPPTGWPLDYFNLNLDGTPVEYIWDEPTQAFIKIS